MEAKSGREKEKRGGMSSFQKAWEVLFPYLLYYLAYSAAYIILSFVREGMAQNLGSAYQRLIAGHEATVAGMTGGLSMLAGILPLMPMFRKELLWRESVTDHVTKRDGMDRAKETFITSLITCVVAVSSSLGLNALLMLTGFADSSATYREVAANQYGVAFAAGVVLYGLVSPLAEEVVFRGVIFNRMRRHYGSALAIVVSGFFFGAFHGNLVQGVYGGCMGILMAFFYERSGRFMISVLFHAAANLAVYLVAYMDELQNILFTPTGCVILLAASVGCVLFYWKV